MMDTIISRSKFWVVAKGRKAVQKTLKLVGLSSVIACLTALFRMPTFFLKFLWHCDLPTIIEVN